MTGETDIKKLLQGMKPKRNEGDFVYCTVDSAEHAAELDPLCVFREKEAVTVVVPKQRADEAGLSYPVVCAWLTLTVHSSLEAVGLTAAVSKALTEANISCNVVAAFYHDHIFVPVKDADRAIAVLENLSQRSNM